MWRALVTIALLIAGTARATPMPDRTERVVGAARLWAKAKFFHPYLAYKAIDWDAAFIAALPAVEAATTIDQYKTALAAMLGKLGDPATRIGDLPGTSAVAPGGAAMSWPMPGIMLIDLAAFTATGFDSNAFQKRGTEIEQAAVKAHVLVIDLRANQPTWITASAMSYFDSALPAIEQWPVQRVLEHHGWRTQEGQTSGGYDSAFVTKGGKPAAKAKPTGPQYVVFVADSHSTLPIEAFALQANGRATIVSTGPLDPAASVSRIEVALPGDITAHVRIGESLWGVPTADVIAKDPRPRALQIATTAVAKPRTPKQVDLPPLEIRDDADYAGTPYPSRELRILAGVRAWATLDHFHAYRQLVPDWDGVFREMLPRLEAAPDRETYITVLREMGARTGDGHVGVAVAKVDPTLKPRGTTGVYLRLVEGKVAVMRAVDPEARELLVAGDVIEAIDGKPVAELIAKKRPMTSAGTEAARDQRIVRDLGFGDAGTVAKLAVRDARGKLRAVVLPRTVANLKAVTEPPAIEHYRTLPNKVGYVNLMLLTVPEVLPMLAALADTRAIVFDMRGYPNGVAWTLAPRLNVKHAPYSAQFLKPLVTGETSGDRIRFLQEIAQVPEGTPLYQGKVVVLIDDRAVSQAEHTCLFLSEAAGATFVGSPTHGTNGDVTAMRLPGGLRMYFTGQEVRWVDGRPLQRVGVQPTIAVKPTLAGIRAGKDEVLERALRFVLKGK